MELMQMEMFAAVVEERERSAVPPKRCSARNRP